MKERKNRLKARKETICKPVTENTSKIKGYETDKHGTSSWNINELLALHCVQSSPIPPLHCTAYSVFCLHWFLWVKYTTNNLNLSQHNLYISLVILCLKGNLEYRCCTLLMYTEVFHLSLINETNRVKEKSKSVHTKVHLKKVSIYTVTFWTQPVNVLAC